LAVEWGKSCTRPDKTGTSGGISENEVPKRNHARETRSKRSVAEEGASLSFGHTLDNEGKIRVRKTRDRIGTIHPRGKLEEDILPGFWEVFWSYVFPFRMIGIGKLENIMRELFL